MKYKSITKKFATVAAAAFALMATNSQAVVIFNDTFDVGTTPTVGDDAGDPDDTAFTAVSGMSVSVNTTNQLASGNSLFGNVSSSVNLLVTQFAAQTLAAVGDSITLSFDYRWQDATAGNTDRIPVFGLYNTGGTASDYTDDIGYNAQFITGTTNVIRFFRELAGDNPLTGSGDSPLGSTPYTYDGTKRNFTMTLSRIADTNADSMDDLRVSLDLVDPEDDDNNLSGFSAVDTTQATFTFDQFALRSRSTSFYLDNVSVSTSIPEPGSIALLFGGSLLLGARRKRITGR